MDIYIILRLPIGLVFVTYFALFQQLVFADVSSLTFIIWQFLRHCHL
jgi:hypothetical protein